MTVEIALSAVTTAGFGLIALFEYFAQDSPGVGPRNGDRSNQPVKVLLASCVVIGNLIIWIPAIFGW